MFYNIFLEKYLLFNVSNSLQAHALQHTRLLCPSLSPRVSSNSCPSSLWYHPTISSCHPLLFLPTLFPSIRVSSNELTLHIRWPKYWSFIFSISPSNEYCSTTSKIKRRFPSPDNIGHWWSLTERGSCSLGAPSTAALPLLLPFPPLA